LARRLRDAIESSSDAYLAFTTVQGDDKQPRDFIFIDTNQTALRQLGITRDQLIGQALLDSYGALLPKWVFDRFVEATAIQQIRIIEAEFLRPKLR
jgi:PAS domain-containing protein